MRWWYALCAWLVWCVPSEAHFLWLVPQATGDAQEIHAYFSEAATPDDPKLLTKFQGLTATQSTRDRNGMPQQEVVPFKPREQSLAAPWTSRSTNPIVANQTYGVVTRGGETFLLQYHAKTYPTPLPGLWTAVNDPALAPLEITPTVKDRELTLRVIWKGEPLAGSQVTVEGPGLEPPFQANADEHGQVRCRLASSGLFSIRARHIEQMDGKLNEERYTSIRHYATVAIPFSIPLVAPVTHPLPHLPRGITSFGAAVADDFVFVYGGHFGDTHHYAATGQSDEFLRLSLTSASPAWESLLRGPRLTGLSMVSHQGRLYRLGGFTARNGEKEDQDLWSQDGFAQFDPAVGQWIDLPPLPEPRSSHDAAVLEGKLYVVGGWKLAGARESVWHDTAWVCNLNAQPLAWSPLPNPPFHRRALSLAACDGKLYVLGGMQKSGQPTTQVDIYDPAARQWSRGPALIGQGMEGFGNSSFAWNGRLVATTMSGSIQQLSEDGTGWNIVGQLNQPRFFHRQLITPAGQLLVLGGASMQTGKTNSVELFQLVKTP